MSKNKTPSSGDERDWIGERILEGIRRCGCSSAKDVTVYKVPADNWEKYLEIAENIGQINFFEKEVMATMFANEVKGRTPSELKGHFIYYKQDNKFTFAEGEEDKEIMCGEKQAWSLFI